MGNRNSGRRPVSTALKILRGNPGQGKLNQAEPVPPAGEVVVPDTLSPGARVVWDRLAPIAIAMHTLTPADVEAFSTLCELRAAFDLVVDATATKGFSPVVVTIDDAGNMRTTVHAATRAQVTLSGAMRPYFERFGLEPSGRSRISVGSVAGSVSKWAGFVP